jgi:hypothetical protein
MEMIERIAHLGQGSGVVVEMLVSCHDLFPVPPVPAPGASSSLALKIDNVNGWTSDH